MQNVVQAAALLCPLHLSRSRAANTWQTTAFWFLRGSHALFGQNEMVQIFWKEERQGTAGVWVAGASPPLGSILANNSGEDKRENHVTAPVNVSFFSGLGKRNASGLRLRHDARDAQSLCGGRVV